MLWKTALTVIIFILGAGFLALIAWPKKKMYITTDNKNNEKLWGI